VTHYAKGDKHMALAEFTLTKMKGEILKFLVDNQTVTPEIVAAACTSNGIRYTITPEQVKWADNYLKSLVEDNVLFSRSSPGQPYNTYHANSLFVKFINELKNANYDLDASVDKQFTLVG
jgi:hypothetical protein